MSERPRRNLVIGSTGQVGGALLECLADELCIGTSRSGAVSGSASGAGAESRSGVVCDSASGAVCDSASGAASASEAGDGSSSGSGTGLAAAAADVLEFDLESAARRPELAAELLARAKADRVFLAAGMTWVDGCEADPELARRINCDAAGVLATAARRHGATFVYFSTEYVFDGRAGPYSETDAAYPRSVYGRSKLEGEQAVASADPEALILRTTVVYGPEVQGKNFAYRLVGELAAGREIQVPDDQISSPTYNRDLAAAALCLCGLGECGVWNVVGPEVMDRYTFAVRVARALGLPDDRIRPVKTAALGQPAERPLRAGLKIDKLESRLGRSVMRGVDAAIEHWLEHPRGRSWHESPNDRKPN